MTEVKLDEKTEVTKTQYDYINAKFAGVCFHKKENDKYFIKLGMSKYKDIIQLIINDKLDFLTGKLK